MIIYSLLILLYSNAVTLRRDKSILFSRVAITVLLSSSLLAWANLDFSFLDIGIGLLIFALLYDFFFSHLMSYKNKLYDYINNPFYISAASFSYLTPATNKLYDYINNHFYISTDLFTNIQRLYVRVALLPNKQRLYVSVDLLIIGLLYYFFFHLISLYLMYGTKKLYDYISIYLMYATKSIYDYISIYHFYIRKDLYRGLFHVITSTQVLYILVIYPQEWLSMADISALNIEKHD